MDLRKLGFLGLVGLIAAVSLLTSGVVRTFAERHRNKASAQALERFA
ncbi:MAG: hypothetical protein ACYDAY_11995 [Candidatus Dormibacteria bacterium]